MSKIKDIFEKKITDRTLKIGVIGLGYVGLPLAVEFGKAGYDVVGIDIDIEKVQSINNGQSHIIDIKDEEVSILVKNGRLRATTEFSEISKLDSLSICVPTPLNKNQEPDTSFIVKTVDNILEHLKEPVLMILESTTYPGTTRELLAERFNQNGYKIDKDYFLCFSPERVDPGNKKYKTRQIPKVMGGLTQNSTEVGCFLYEKIIDKVVPVSSPETAEMSKLLENTFRSINIAFINEMALMCDRMGIDIWETIDAASTKPFGFMPFYPGAGVGGHCIPLDPMYLYWKGKQERYFNQFIELSQRINLNMPYRVIDKIRVALDSTGKTLSDSNILMIGLSYKDNIDDIRESPALDIYEQLKKETKKIDIFDPYVKSFSDMDGTRHLVIQEQSEIKFSEYDGAIILAKHENIDFDEILEKIPTIVDMKRTWKTKHKKVVTIGG
ncbi:nucleotide sugar dehydrogenase [Enterococcus mundtii]|uniref:nucleotide sugar dehydrogenase n=1 Tax=Enterococcus TaxID=1350 RepID=UPI0032DF2079